MQGIFGKCTGKRPAWVYFPKYVVINNPRLAFLYWMLLVLFVGAAMYIFFSREQWGTSSPAYGEVSLISWMLKRSLSEIKSSFNVDMNRTFCSGPGDPYHYESARVPYTDIECASLCSRDTAGSTCVDRTELVMQDSSKVFVPTFFTQRSYGSAGETNISHYFVPGAEDARVAFRHRFEIDQPKNSFLAGQLDGISTNKEGSLLTVLLDMNGGVIRKFQPGEVISLRVSEILSVAKVEEYMDTVTYLSLDDNYIRFEEDILTDRPFGRDHGPTVRLTGATITIDLQYTNRGKCRLDHTTEPQQIEWSGEICCMSVKAARKWTTKTRTSVLDFSGSQSTRTYHGLQINFNQYGSFIFMDNISIFEWVTVFLIWSQIPTLIIYSVITTILGNLSKIYKHVIHQNLSVAEALTGLGTRLVSHSSSFLDMADSAGVGRSKLLNRFRAIFKHSEDLQDEEIMAFVDFVHKGLVKDGDAEIADNAVHVGAFCSACCSDESIDMQGLAKIFDTDRRLGFFERIFNDPAISQLRTKDPSGVPLIDQDEFGDVDTNNPAEGGYSQVESLFESIPEQEKRLEGLQQMTDRVCTLAAEAASADMDAVYERKRKELARAGPPQSRPERICSNGATYTGEWVDKHKHGEGVEVWPNGDRYEGQFQAGLVHGHCVKKFANGARYDGQWHNGKRHGQGTEMSPEGSKYEGEYKSGDKCGTGTFYMVDGSTYKGAVQANKMHGHGVYIWSNGHKYDGQWVKDEMHGQGIYTFANGMQYEGQYSHNLKHGRGIFTYPDGRKYDGEYAENERHGRGTFTSPDGTRIEGTWVKSKQHGEGTITTAKGTTVYAVWEMGTRKNSRQPSRGGGSNARR